MVREVSVFLPNVPGQFSRVLKALASASVNIRGFSVDLSGAISELRLLFKNRQEADTAMVALREYNYETIVRDLLLLSAADEPGELLRVAEILGDNGINVEYGYVALGQTEAGDVLFAIKVKDGRTKLAIECLEAEGIPDHDEIPEATRQT